MTGSQIEAFGGRRLEGLLCQPFGHVELTGAEGGAGSRGEHGGDAAALLIGRSQFGGADQQRLGRVGAPVEEFHLGQGLERGGAFDLGGAVGLVQDRDRLPLDLEGLVVAPLKGAGSGQHGEGDPVLAGIGGVGAIGHRAEALKSVLGSRDVP